MGKNLISQRRGKGTTSFRAPSFNFKGEASVPNIVTTGVVVDLVKCPAHSAPLVLVDFATGKMGMMIAPDGISVGHKFSVGTDVIAVGNVVELKDIPEGTLIHNLERIPGDGGKFIRASGTSARVANRVKGGITIMMPSKQLKVFHDKCRATIGVVAGGGRTEKPLFKAGNRFFKEKAKNHLYPVVAGSAMNAVSHPFGNKRSSRKSKNRPVSRDAPPGRKVGYIASRRTGRKTKASK
jgi:large subunit ribosomal protein L2